jgi:DMSO reductase anchor subunit
MIASVVEQVKATYEWVDVVTTIVSFLTMIFSGYAAWTLLRRKRAWRQLAGKAVADTGFQAAFKQHAESSSANPFALSVNLLPNQTTCKPDIERYYKERGLRCPSVAEISVPGITDPGAQLAEILATIRSKRIHLDSEAATEVHLFFAGPVGAALHLGAALDNWKLVKVFQWNKGAYEYWGVL